MAYKTCPDCGCRIFEYGCVNCNEQDYIDMQGAYEPPKTRTKIKDVPISSPSQDEINEKFEDLRSESREEKQIERQERKERFNP